MLPARTAAPSARIHALGPLAASGDFGESKSCAAECSRLGFTETQSPGETKGRGVRALKGRLKLPRHQAVVSERTDNILKHDTFGTFGILFPFICAPIIPHFNTVIWFVAIKSTAPHIVFSK